MRPPPDAEPLDVMIISIGGGGREGCSPLNCAEIHFN